MFNDYDSDVKYIRDVNENTNLNVLMMIYFSGIFWIIYTYIYPNVPHLFLNTGKRLKRNQTILRYMYFVLSYCKVIPLAKPIHHWNREWQWWSETMIRHTRKDCSVPQVSLRHKECMVQVSAAGQRSDNSGRPQFACGRRYFR